MSTLTRAESIGLGDWIVTESGRYLVTEEPERPTRTAMLVTVEREGDKQAARFSFCTTELVRLHRRNGEHTYRFVQEVVA